MATSIREGLITFMRERMAVFDSSLDTSAGSRFFLQVLQPLLRRLGADPTEVSAEQVILDRLAAYDPTLNTERGSGIRDLLVTPLSTILEPFRMAILDVRRQASWRDLDSLTEDEAERLASNVFVSRDQGQRATGSLRLLFGSPRDVFLTPANVAYAGSLRFFPLRTQTISNFALAAQISGAFYYFDVDMIAENPGTEYEVSAGSITHIEGVTGLVAVQQRRRFINGRHRQTKEELRDHTREAITTRTGASVRALRTLMRNHFPTVRSEIQGRGDFFMERDLLRGPLHVSGIPQGIRGLSSPTLGAVSGGIHLGGMTDVWVAPSNPSEDLLDSVDVANLYDEGSLVFWSPTGSVTGSTTPRYLNDDGAFFLESDGGRLPVLPGDLLVVQGILQEEGHREFVIDTVEAKRIRVEDLGGISLADTGLFSYAIRRRKAGVIAFDPHHLVAQDSDGSPLLSSSGLPLLPIPGRLFGAEGAASQRNRSSSNLRSPVGEILQVEMLDPISLQPLGTLIPEADPLAFYLADRVSPSVFTVRAVFRLPTQFAVFSNASGLLGSLGGTRFYSLDESRLFDPMVLMTGDKHALPVAEEGVAGVTALLWLNEVTSSSLYTPLLPRAPQPGDLLTFLVEGGSHPVWEVITEVNVGGDPHLFRVQRPVFPLGLPGRAAVTQGTLASAMTLHEGSGLYGCEFLVSRTVGSGEVLGETLALPTSTFYSQGWRLFSRLESHSFSVEEDLTFEVTHFVNDDLDLRLAGTGLRITYLTTPLVKTLQTFFDQDEERLPAEDVLVRRMPYAWVHLSLRYLPDDVLGTPSETAATESLSEFLLHAGEVTATEISNIVERLGAREVTYPFFCLVEFSGKSRSGRAGHGRLHSFRSGNGTVIPEGAVETIRHSHRLADMRPGRVLVVLAR
jgi:hypothetical protein